MDRWGHSQGSRWLQRTRKSRFISHLTRARGERELAAQGPKMAQILSLILTPREPKTFLCSDRDSAGRDDHRPQSHEGPRNEQSRTLEPGSPDAHPRSVSLVTLWTPLFLSPRLNKWAEHTEVSTDMANLQPSLGWHCPDSWAAKEASVRYPWSLRPGDSNGPLS